MKILILVSAFFLLFLAATANARDGQEISVKVGETKTASKSGFKVKFVAVLEDSRCPEGANCVWAGIARIQVSIETKNGDSTTVELASFEENQHVEKAGYRIHLVKLDPKPSAKKAPESNEYLATFRFEKL